MGVAHTDHRLVKIDALGIDTTELELVHHVVERLLGIEVLGTWSVGGERRDAIGQTLLHEVVAQVHVVLGTHGKGHIDRTCPVGIGKYLEHHEVALVEGTLATQGDDHAIGNGVALKHHAAVTHGILVDSHIEGIGRNDVEVLVGGAHPVLQDVAQFEGFFAKLLASLLRLLGIELEHLLLE